MKSKTKNALKLTAEHAAKVLHHLIAEGKLTAKDVTEALKRREQMIVDLRQRLAALEHGAVASTQKAGRRISAQVKPKVKRKLTAARRAALKLGGEYMGVIRRLPAKAKAEIKAIRQKSGFRAAIAAAKKMAK